MDFEGNEPEDWSCPASPTSLARIRMLEVGAKEGGDVGSGLGDDKMIHVEELSDTRQWRLTTVVTRLLP